MRVYLAGPITGRSDADCRDWREAVKGAFPQHAYLDPMRRDYRGKEDASVKEIVEGDKVDIARCDALLVFYDAPSVGTSMEVLYAWERGKAVVVVAEPGARVSPWLRYHSHAVVPSLTRGIEALESLRNAQTVDRC